MGLFGKKEPCPVCGSEVKGLFLKKIGGKKTLCKECSNLISMPEDTIKNASVELAKENIEYRKDNVAKYHALNWDTVYNDIPNLRVGVDSAARALYLVHFDLNTEFDYPLVLDFDQLKDYRLCRGKKKTKLDDMSDEGPVVMETLFSVLKSFSNGMQSDTDWFYIQLKTTDPYWPDLELKITFDIDKLHGPFGFGKQLEAVCNTFKGIIGKNPDMMA